MNNLTASVEQINARLTNFKLTGDPATLWPDIPPEQLASANRAALATVQACLRPTRTHTLPNDVVEIDPRAMSVAAYVLGVGGLLGYWAERGSLFAPSDVRALLANHLQHGRQRAELMRQRLLAILEACNQKGIEPTILKGAYTGPTYFPEFGTRPLTDIDLLVEPRHLATTRDVLGAIGLQEETVSYGQSTWCPTGVSLQVVSLEFEHRDNPWSVDLHTYLDRRYFWGLWCRFGDRPDDETRSWVYEGCKAKVFTQPLLISHLAQHAVQDFRFIRLLRIVELVMVLRRDLQTGALTWDALASDLTESSTARFVYPAFELCARLAPDTVDLNFLAELSNRATPRLRRVIDRWWDAGVGVHAKATWDERLMWAETPAELLGNVAHQVARRAMERLSPISVPRLRLLLRQKTGIAPRRAPPQR